MVDLTESQSDASQIPFLATFPVCPPPITLDSGLPQAFPDEQDTKSDATFDSNPHVPIKRVGDTGYRWTVTRSTLLSRHDLGTSPLWFCVALDR